MAQEKQQANFEKQIRALGSEIIGTRTDDGRRDDGRRTNFEFISSTDIVKKS